MTNDYSLKGKNILVAGASGGIGRASCLKLAGLGANVIMAGRNKEKLETLKNDMEKQNFRAQAYPADFEKPEELEKIFVSILNDIEKSGGGELHGLLYAAGEAPFRPLKSNIYKIAQKTFLINYHSFIELTRLFAKQKTQGGSIVAISSIAAVKGETGRAAYCGSKGALESSVKALARELAPRNIRVNVIRPGLTDTPMAEEYVDFIGKDALKDYLKNAQLLGMITPEAVAETACFLLSEKARFITGAAFTIDAGATL